jgi:predicted extracellular nuclease
MSRIRLLVVLVAVAVLAVVPSAVGATSTVVVSQVFAGGGNAGASYTNDFVELFNRGSSAIDVTGWTIQYASASSTSWQATALTGSIGPGRFYLVQLASTASVGAPLPAPDANGTTNLANSGGKVALVHDATALTCGASAGSCSGVALVDDLVGYGNAIDYEGAAPAPTLSNTTAAVRGSAGCSDTNSNATDFTAVTPAPRNLAEAAAPCSSGGGSATTQTGSAAVDVDVQSVLSLSLERPSVSFTGVVAGTTPSPISERVTVMSTNASGYSLTVHRSAFAPSDLPLGIAAIVGGVVVAIPVAPALDLLIATSSAASAGAGDAWPTSIGFSSALPAVAPGRYTATLTFTVIGR